MRIAIPNDSKQGLGGGWTFRNNFIKGLKNKAEITDIENSDVVLLTSSTMILPETVRKAKELNKPIVLRVDNVPRNSRNRNTGTSRLKSYTEIAKAVVFQSEWAKRYLGSYLGHDGLVIYNGVDTQIFNKDGDKYNWSENVYLYSRFNRDETKRWEEAWYKFQMIHRDNPFSKLKIVGNFSPEQIEYNFDFFMGEDVEYLGIISEPKEMAKIYRSCDYFLATYYNDCYSNTYCEALASGMELYDPSLTGGTPEILENYKKGVRTIDDMANDYLNLFKEVLS